MKFESPSHRADKDYDQYQIVGENKQIMVESISELVNERRPSFNDKKAENSHNKQI